MRQDEEKMQQKFANFISHGPIECASGGRTQTSWLRGRFMAALAGIGIIGALLLPARISDNLLKTPPITPSLRLVAEFQEKVNRLPGSATIVILDHNLALSDPLYINTRIRGEQLRRNLPFSNASATALVRKWARDMLIPHTLPASRELRTVINAPHKLTPRMEWQIAASPTCPLARSEAARRAAGLMNIQVGGRPGAPLNLPPFNPGILPPPEQFDRATLYHEAFGHATECTAELASPTTGARHAYQRHLQELRAELAGVAGLACENGNTRMGRLRALLLDAGGPGRILSGKEQYYPYATLGPHLVKACDKIDAILANPAHVTAFRAMDGRALVAFTDKLFAEMKPGPAEYAATLRAITPLARHGTQRALRRARRKDARILAAFLGRAETATRALMKNKKPPMQFPCHPHPNR